MGRRCFESNLPAHDLISARLNTAFCFTGERVLQHNPSALEKCAAIASLGLPRQRRRSSVFSVAPDDLHAIHKKEPRLPSGLKLAFETTLGSAGNRHTQIKSCCRWAACV